MKKRLLTFDELYKKFKELDDKGYPFKSHEYTLKDNKTQKTRNRKTQ